MCDIHCTISAFTRFVTDPRLFMDSFLHDLNEHSLFSSSSTSPCHKWGNTCIFEKQSIFRHKFQSQVVWSMSRSTLLASSMSQSIERLLVSAKVIQCEQSREYPRNVVCIRLREPELHNVRNLENIPEMFWRPENLLRHLCTPRDQVDRKIYQDIDAS